MAIIYTTGTINQPDAGSVGLTMAEKIRDDVVAHPAWVLEEEFTPATGAVRWYVFKCLAAESGLPNDFFIVMGRTLSNGELRFAICEGYNAAGHVMSFFARRSGSGANYDASGRATDTYALSTVVLPTAANNAHYHSWIPSGTSTKWWITVDSDGFAVAFNGPSNGFIHCGAYVPLTALPILMPIQLIGSSDNIGGITRNPAVASIASAINTSALIIQGGASTAPGNGPLLGFPGDLRYNDKLQNNQRPVAEQGLIVPIGNNGDQAQNGWALGKQKRMRITNASVPVGFAFGDAYALDGSLWVPYLPTDGRMWNTGVASS